MRTIWWMALLFSAQAAVVDRVAVVVGNHVITESEVDEEVRITAFLNQQTVDLSVPQRRAAADRLVDQQLIRIEMEAGGYPQPEPSEADTLVRKFRQEHYLSAQQFRQALEKYGITDEELKQHLLWQLTAVRFTDVRFQPGVPGPSTQTANRLRAGAEPPPQGDSVDRQMEAWLKETRTQTRIEFKKEAFQ